VFIYNVTADCASNLPSTEAPVTKLIANPAKIVPEKLALAPRLTVDPATCQKILLELAPPIRFTLVLAD